MACGSGETGEELESDDATSEEGASDGNSDCKILQHGSACFGEPKPFGLGTDSPVFFLPIDVDGDGDDELITPQGNIYGGFFGGDLQTSKIGGLNDETFITIAGDFDGDGREDLVAQSSQRELSVFFNDGDGSFENNGVPFSPSFDEGSAYYLAVGDFDQDGFDDLAALGDDEGKVAIFLGRGDRSLIPGATLDACDAAIIASGDVDGDGAIDLAWDCGNALHVHFGDGTGGFPERSEVYIGIPATEPCSPGLNKLGSNGVAITATGGKLNSLDGGVVVVRAIGADRTLVGDSIQTGHVTDHIAAGRIDHSGASTVLALYHGPSGGELFMLCETESKFEECAHLALQRSVRTVTVLESKTRREGAIAFNSPEDSSVLWIIPYEPSQAKLN